MVMSSVQYLSQSELLSMFEGLMRTDHRTDADTLVFLREIDRRKIWAIDGYDSLVTWCVRKGHMSESVAFKRIKSAELAERFPAALALIRRGELHLSALNKLGPHLTDANHEAVLTRARCKTMKELDLIIAELAPQPDIETSVRPMRAAPAAPSEPSLFAVAPPIGRNDAPSRSSSPAAPSALPSPPRAKVTPTAPRRFKLEMTLSERGHEMLRELEALLSHASAGVGEIVERGLEALLEQTKRKRCGAASRRRQPREQDDATGDESRHVPAEVRHEVWERDGAQCTFVAADGHRCESRAYLQLHHIEPFARGGPTVVENVALLCGVHNRLEGERVYGRGFMENKIAARKSPHVDCHVAAGSPYS